MSEPIQTPPEKPEPNLEAPRSGRPFVFTKPEELKVAIQGYFDTCDPHITTRQVENGRNGDDQIIWAKREVMTEQIPYTVTGLARHLGVSRSTLVNYKRDEHYNEEIPLDVRQELINTIEDAYQRVEEYNERALHRSGVSNGIKFNLTNNFGWEDKKVVDQNNRSVEDELDNLDDKDDRDKVADEAAAELAKQNGDGAPAQDQASDENKSEESNEAPGSTPKE